MIKKATSNENRARIAILYYNGMPRKEIAIALNFNKTTVLEK